jgi:thiol-disulfide isomerase/thioredoxin
VRLKILLGVLALSLVALCNRGRIQGWALSIEPGKKAGQMAPELPQTLRTLDGGKISLGALRGQVVLVHFWTFGCGNCEHMVPSYNAWAARWPALHVIGVHTPETDGERDVARLRETVKQRHISWRVVLDDDEIAWSAFGVRAWPTVFVIDRDGRIAGAFVGDDRPEDIEGLLVKLLG